ncbi:alpha/beta hydrolase [Rhodococcus sp. SJ-3]|uniref:alpha/beta hydrolase n=1 Tax=Rhodococcus sp. SJ-3 TaxID=3454628 RepID=UPI003F78DCCC
MESIGLRIDVTDAASLGEHAEIAVTIQLPLPELLGAVPVICFAKPGAGATRGYYFRSSSGAESVSQAEWHAARGWVFVALDHLGAGASTTHHDDMLLNFGVVSAANHAAEQAVTRMLVEGTVLHGYPKLNDPVLLGIGHSMGGALAITQQGRYHDYHGLAVLGYSAVHSHPVAPPGTDPIVHPWRLRDPSAHEREVVLNRTRIEMHLHSARPLEISSKTNQWFFHYDDVDPAAIENDGWRSTTYPRGVTASVLTPGVVAPEAAAVTTPVLVAMGERDTVVDPKGEARAYVSSSSVDLFVCPRMAHMHNFAGTRELMWQRIHHWGSWVRSLVMTESTL